jgi:hypothetical protein
MASKAKRHGQTGSRTPADESPTLEEAAAGQSAILAEHVDGHAEDNAPVAPSRAASKRQSADKVDAVDDRATTDVEKHAVHEAVQELDVEHVAGPH